MGELLEAIQDLKAQPQRLARVAVALYEATNAGVRQVDLVRATGYTRENIRRLVEDERIRRGEIQPTRRYIAAQKRAGAT